MLVISLKWDCSGLKLHLLELNMTTLEKKEIFIPQLGNLGNWIISAFICTLLCFRLLAL